MTFSLRQRCFCGLAVILLLFAWGVHAQVGILGIIDRSYGAYLDQATFVVTNEAGFSYDARLDGNSVPVGVPITVRTAEYHEIRVWRTNVATLQVTNQLVRFIIRDSIRDGSEDGLLPWTPAPPINSTAAEFTGGTLRLITPQEFPTGYPIPAVAWVENAQGHAIRANGLVTASGHPSFLVKRGVGSGFLAATNPAGVLSYTPQIGGLPASKTITLQSGTAWTTVSGILGANTTWPANSRISVAGGIIVPAGGTLTVGAGSIVIVGPGINISNLGSITINGTVTQPAVFMPATTGQPWGGFVQHANNASVTASGAIFVSSGADQCWYDGHGRCSTPTTGWSSHRPEQPLFSLSGTECNITLTDCASIAGVGQFGHGRTGLQRLTLTRTMVQGGSSGGEYSATVFSINDSALFDFWITSTPFWQFVDNDEDGLYIADIPTGYISGLTNTLIGWTRDDGVDSGGGGAGYLKYKNCWFEATYHEGNSLSGNQTATAHTDKDVSHFDSVFFGCGQAIENGYGAVTGRFDHCLVVGGNIGFRFGDNYNWQYYGMHHCSNSILVGNYRDVWGMTWQPDTSGAYAGWLYRTNEMNVLSNWLTAPNLVHPSNSVWNASADGWRLASFMSTPPDAAVGAGFAVWTNQFPMTNLFAGVPVGLSCFTTNPVVVDYEFRDAADATLASGTLTIPAGFTTGKIYPSGFDVSVQSTVRVLLRSAVHGELTDLTNVTFLGSVPAPQVTCWISTNQFMGYRMSEGVLVRLTSPSGQPVSVNYAYQGPTGVQASGLLSFAPGETVKQVLPTGVPALSWIRLDLANPVGATLSGITSVSYTNPPTVVSFATANVLSFAAFSNALPVALTVAAPAGGATVDFKYEANGGTLTNGILTFTQGQTLVQLSAPTIDPQSFEAIRVVLSNPVRAGLGIPASVYYLRTVMPFTPTNTTFVASNSVWYYFDKTNDLGTAWRSNSFDSSSWSNGCAQLGFSGGPAENDECTKITSNEVNTCYYFRKSFVIDDPLNFTNMALWILEDDSAVVYLNGAEVFRGTNLAAAPTIITNRTLTKVSGPDNTVETNLVSRSFLQTGSNLVAVEMHQSSRTSSDASFDLRLAGTAVSPPTLSPPPVIASPTNGQAFASGSTIAITVNATNTYTNIVLYADSVRVGLRTASPFSFTVSSLDSGNHELVALGSDSTGTTLASLPISISIAAPSNITVAASYSVGSGFAMQFSADANASYSVLYADVIPTNYWAKLLDVPTAPTNRSVSITNDIGLSPHRFYRLVTPAQ